MSFRCATASVLLLLAPLWSACGESTPQGGVSDGGVDGPVESRDGGRDSTPSGDGAIVADAGGGAVGDAQLAPIRLGLTPASALAGSQLTLSHLEVLAAGSRAASFVRDWRALTGPGAQADQFAWEELGRLIELQAAGDRQVLLNLAIVDGSRDGRPLSLHGGWSGEKLRNALQVMINRAFELSEPGVTYLVFGRDIDRWLSQANRQERGAFEELIQHGLSYARSHASRSAEMRFAVGVSAATVKSGLSDEAIQLIRASDAVVLSYYPLNSAFMAKPAETASADLQDVMQTLSELGVDDRPVVLQEVGYPTDPLVSGSQEAQQTFFGDLFNFLETHRARIPFAAVFASQDPPAEQCLEMAIARGYAGSDPAKSPWCSMGVRADDGHAKLGFARVLAGLATFSSP